MVRGKTCRLHGRVTEAELVGNAVADHGGQVDEDAAVELEQDAGLVVDRDAMTARRPERAGVSVEAVGEGDEPPGVGVDPFAVLMGDTPELAEKVLMNWSTWGESDDRRDRPFHVVLACFRCHAVGRVTV